jgi:hypothetical protein
VTVLRARLAVAVDAAEWLQADHASVQRAYVAAQRPASQSMAAETEAPRLLRKPRGARWWMEKMAGANGLANVLAQERPLAPAFLDWAAPRASHAAALF